MTDSLTKVGYRAARAAKNDLDTNSHWLGSLHAMFPSIRGKELTRRTNSRTPHSPLQSKFYQSIINSLNSLKKTPYMSFVCFCFHDFPHDLINNVNIWLNLSQIFLCVLVFHPTNLFLGQAIVSYKCIWGQTNHYCAMLFRFHEGYQYIIAH